MSPHGATGTINNTDRRSRPSGTLVAAESEVERTTVPAVRSGGVIASSMLCQHRSLYTFGNSASTNPALRRAAKALG